MADNSTVQDKLDEADGALGTATREYREAYPDADVAEDLVLQRIRRLREDIADLIDIVGDC
jgi:hypothetical protein